MMLENSRELCYRLDNDSDPGYGTGSIVMAKDRSFITGSYYKDKKYLYILYLNSSCLTIYLYRDK